MATKRGSKKPPRSGVTLRLDEEQRAKILAYQRRHGILSMAAALWHGFTVACEGAPEVPTAKDRLDGVSAKKRRGVR